LKEEVGWPEEGIRALYNTEVLLWVLGYYLLQLVLYVVLPGEVVDGTELNCSGRLRYKFNGNTTHVVRSLTASSDLVDSFPYGGADSVWLGGWDLLGRRRFRRLDISLG
jgi:delta14-sterol reductase